MATPDECWRRLEKVRAFMEMVPEKRGWRFRDSSCQ